MTNYSLWMLVGSYLTLVLVFLWFAFFEYRRYRADFLRHALFKIRDRLFDAAERGELPFESQALKVTWQTLNGMIYYADVIGPMEIVIRRILSKKYGINVLEEVRGYDQRLAAALQDVSPTARIIIENALSDAHRAIFKYIVRTNIFILAIAILDQLIRLLLRRRRMLMAYLEDAAISRWRWFKKWWNYVDTTANWMGLERIPHN